MAVNARWVFAIDPGTTQSAFVFYDALNRLPGLFGKEDNAVLLLRCHQLVRTMRLGDRTAGVIEKIAGYGMPVGAEVFETVFWTGRFYEALAGHGLLLARIPRLQVKLHLCKSPRANDATIRQALIDRFGPGKDKAIGTKAKPGPLYGMSGDVWAALAVAVTYADGRS